MAEDSESPTPSSPATAVVWNQTNAERIWKEAISMVEPMTETLARAVQRVVAEEGKLRLVFPGESKLAFSRCESPQHKTPLNTAVAKLAGCDIALELQLAAPKPVAAKAVVVDPGRSRMQRMKEIEANVMVKSIVEVFEAEIVKIEKPR